MPPALLISECLQNDFVKPVDRYESLPNVLHVGFEEARRLMGENPSSGPVAQLMRWAYSQPDSALKIIHIRDWHDPHSDEQAPHLKQFGDHCLKDTPGSGFAFEAPASGEKSITLIDSLTLNDFSGTSLAATLKPYERQDCRAGLIGVWTEAKISFLCYELKTRYPRMDVAVCSALTASSSRAHHFMALDQLERLLGVTVLPSIGEFMKFLGGPGSGPTLPETAGEHPALSFEGEPRLGETDRKLIKYLFRDAKSVRLKCLDGGFSGNVVLGADSVDLYGHAQVHHVVKIGPQGPIGKERASFERVESVLGNNAPHLADFADLADRGGIKYRYAAMGGGFSTTFQKLYMKGLSREKTTKFLDAVFREHLGRFYRAVTREKANLLEYYGFHPGTASRVRPLVESVLGQAALGETLHWTHGPSFNNPCRFYEEELAELLPLAAGSSPFSYVHGDLNGANIIIDAQENVWLIDFFHTHRGHVLKDLIKLENDLLYIFTPLEGAEDFAQALRLSELLMNVSDLSAPLPDPNSAGITRPVLLRALDTIGRLRSYYPPLIQFDRDPLQLWIGQLRYAIHTLSFEESSPAQKRWALYAAGLLSGRIAARLGGPSALRVDWLDNAAAKPGRLGLTLLPGRRDQRRELAADASALKALGVTQVVCLIAPVEFAHYGVEGLFAAYENAGLKTRHLPIMDQKVPSQSEMRELVAWLITQTDAGASIAVHCAGGLGRSGTLAACYLKAKGFSSNEAIAEVRRCRSPRAVETREQEEFVSAFTA